MNVDRVPCKICRAEVLVATAERNSGLCGRCAKGHRPCVYCGGFVSEPLKGGIYAHVGCWIRNRQAEESFEWKKVEDIDWAMIRQLLRSSATRLLQTMARERRDTGNLTLLFFIRVQDFIEITIFEAGPAGTSKRLSDSDWDKDISPLDSSFSIMYETLPEQEALEAIDTVRHWLTSILTDECNQLAKDNFYFASQVQVSWSVKCD